MTIPLFLFIRDTFVFLEKDLNLEIDRLVRVTGEQKRKIAELESHLTVVTGLHSAGDVPTKQFTHSPPLFVDLTKSSIKSKKPLIEKTSKLKTDHKKTCKKASSTTHSVTQKKGKESYESVPPLMLAKCCCEAGGCLKNMKDLLDKEIEYRQVQVSSNPGFTRKFPRIFCYLKLEKFLLGLYVGLYSGVSKII